MNIDGDNLIKFMKNERIPPDENCDGQDTGCEDEADLEEAFRRGGEQQIDHRQE